MPSDDALVRSRSALSQSETLLAQAQQSIVELKKDVAKAEQLGREGARAEREQGDMRHGGKVEGARAEKERLHNKVSRLPARSAGSDIVLSRVEVLAAIAVTPEERK